MKHHDGVRLPVYNLCECGRRKKRAFRWCGICSKRYVGTVECPSCHLRVKRLFNGACDSCWDRADRDDWPNESPMGVG